MIRKGVFGWEGYFEELLQTLSGSRDYYLVANDFPAYLEAQVRCSLCAMLLSVHDSVSLALSSLRCTCTRRAG